MTLNKIYFLDNPIQNYQWGSKNHNAFIPKLLNIIPQKDVPYAELWLGIHPKSPTKIKNSNDLMLKDIIDTNKNDFLGEKNSNKFTQLPFLMKVLSAEMPLSIQTHPNKKQAEILHRIDPINYPDNNHKPEIAISLDSLDALAGFLPQNEMKQIFLLFPEICETVDQFLLEEFLNSKETDNLSLFQPVFKSIINTNNVNNEQIEKSVTKLKNRLLKSLFLSKKEKLFLQCCELYSNNDIGLMLLFFLNYIHLNKGEAIFLEAGVPHAYIKGNIIECMANSDNVVRAGLTPKYKDVNTLVDISNYSGKNPNIFVPPHDKKLIQYPTYTNEFQIQLVNISEKENIFINTNDSIMIGIIINGSGMIKYNNNDIIKFKQGDSFVIPASLKELLFSSFESTNIFLTSIP